MCIRPARRRRQPRASAVPLVTHGTFCLLYSFYLIKKQLKVDTYTEGRRRSELFSRRGVLGKTIALLFPRVRYTYNAQTHFHDASERASETQTERTEAVSESVCVRGRKRETERRESRDRRRLRRR